MEDSNLAKARSSIVWIMAIACAFSAVWWIEKQSGQALIARSAAAPGAPAVAPVSAIPQVLPASDVPAPPLPAPLNAQQMAWAKTAWAYFEHNTDARTGLVGSVDGFASATMWDTGSYLMALMAARDLKLIDARAFDSRMARALASLARMPLHAGALPNKSYDIHTLGMTDYANQPSAAGIGWSAIDIGRLLVPLNLLAWQHPGHTGAARAVIARWKLAALVRAGEMQGMHLAADGKPQALQEGRMGYEQYAARSLAPLGLDVDQAADWNRHLQLLEVDGVKVCADARDPTRFSAVNPVLSEPHLLWGLEFGWTGMAHACAMRTYQAQEARFRRTGVLTAVSEDHTDRAPWFVYNTVAAAGKPWATITDKGEDAAALRSLSVKAAFGWHALVRSDYTARLVEAVATLNDPARGWYAGRYEQGGAPNKALSTNTNAVVLESLAYMARGAFLQFR